MIHKFTKLFQQSWITSIGLSATLHGLAGALLIFDFASIQPKFTEPIAVNVIFSSPSPGGGEEKVGTDLGTISVDAPSSNKKNRNIENVHEVTNSQLRKQETGEKKIILPKEMIEKQEQGNNRQENESDPQFQENSTPSQLIATTTTEGSPGTPGNLTKGIIGKTVAPIYQLGSKNNPLPSYPLIARKNGFEGKVLIEAQVSRQGRIKTILLRESSGHLVLDHAAMEGVKNWKFKPAKRMGLSIDGSVTIPLIFKLKN